MIVFSVDCEEGLELWVSCINLVGVELIKNV